VSTEKDGLKLLVEKLRTNGSSPEEVLAWLIDAYANSRVEIIRLKEVEEDAVRAGYAYGYIDCTDGETEDAETAVARYKEDH
jgi:hypothetical protein